MPETFFKPPPKLIPVETLDIEGIFARLNALLEVVENNEADPMSIGSFFAGTMPKKSVRT